MYKTGCLICGNNLIYTEIERDVSCEICHESFLSYESCDKGHYICDSCHIGGAYEVIKQKCLKYEGKDPVELVNQIFDLAAVKMHGPEHHFIVPAVLIACFYNATDKPILKEEKIKTAQTRAKQVPGGACGYMGSCGAAVGTGIFISTITGSTPLKTEQWQLSNLMTARALQRVAESGGPRCCKRDSYISIQEAVTFIREKINVQLDISPIQCHYDDKNKECLLEGCEFYVR